MLAPQGLLSVSLIVRIETQAVDAGNKGNFSVQSRQAKRLNCRKMADCRVLPPVSAAAALATDIRWWPG